MKNNKYIQQDRTKKNNIFKKSQKQSDIIDKELKTRKWYDLSIKNKVR